MSIWTIVSIDRFRVREGGLRIEFSEAMKANEFARLGDVMILTTPPLQLSVLADKSKPRGLAANDTANFTIGDVKIYGAGREISDPIEKQLAYILMFYGEWNIDGPFSIMDESGIAGARFVAHPEEASEDGMDSIAWASRSFGRYYNSQTLDGDLIKQLDGEPADNWFAPLSKWDFQNAKLSLWVFRLQPSSEATSDEASGKVIANLADGAPTRVQ
jgi:hypothetical protein